MKLWILVTSLTVSLLILSGCGATPTPKENVEIDPTLPIVTLTQSGVIVGMKSIAFEWNSIVDPRVKGIYVYKMSPSEEAQSKLEYYDTITNRFKTHYVDQDVNPDTKYSYSFKAFSEKAEAAQSRVEDVNTLPVLESVSWIHSITGLPRTAKILWRPHTNEKVKHYVVERKTLEDKEWKRVAAVQGRLNAEFIDEELNDNYVYMYRIRVVTYDDITSTPSQFVKVVTKPLPMSIKNIVATNNLPKKIKIDWDKSTQEDFSLYYLYRSEKINGSYELVATLHNNAFIDKIDEDGKSYFYRVSAVDIDGLESKHDAESIQGMTLSKPLAPSIVEAKLVNSQIEIEWKETDNRTVVYVVVKKHKKGWFKENIEEFEGITTTKFIDKNVVAGSAYAYVVYSVDENSIRSFASTEVKVVTPESTEIQEATKQEVEEEVATPVVIEEVQESFTAPTEDLDLSGI